MHPDGPWILTKDPWAFVRPNTDRPTRLLATEWMNVLVYDEGNMSFKEYCWINILLDGLIYLKIKYVFLKLYEILVDLFKKNIMKILYIYFFCRERELTNYIMINILENVFIWTNFYYLDIILDIIVHLIFEFMYLGKRIPTDIGPVLF